jgi:uncharacterized protein with HEPN domain
MNYANFNDMSYSSFKPIKDTKPSNNRYSMLQDHTNKPTEPYVKTAVKGYFRCDKPTEQNELANIFFSGENMQRIQRKLRNEIKERTNGQFKVEVDQDENTLLLAMRNIFLEESRFLPTKIIHQVKELNQKVVNSIVPDMITEIKQYYGYLRDVNEPLKPMDRPLNVSNAGRKTLPSITTSWGL